MEFKFTNLEKLHKDMMTSEEDRVIFPFSFNHKGFSCIFLTDVNPYRLYLTALGNANLSFLFNLDTGYKTHTFISQYKELTVYLELKFDPNNPFKPIDFFDALNRKIPTQFSKKPSYKDVIRLKAGNKVEKSEEENFCGWRHSPTGRVSDENLEKTRRAFGDRYAEMSKKKGISSCWTADDSKENIERLNELISMS